MSSETPIPEEFKKVLKDFIFDLKTTFPEYVSFIDKWWKNKEYFNYIDDETEKMDAYEKTETKSIKLLFDFCKNKFPPRFFDILYQNDDMFKETSNIDTEFLPKIHFKNLWQSDISDKTRETIWKYLQLILFSVVGTLDNKEAFGDSAKMFEAINETDFKTKLQETLGQMQGLFNVSNNDDAGTGSGGLNQSDLPNAEKINEHITGMLGGKIGNLAREIAEDTSSFLNMDLDGATNMSDVFNTLIKNPSNLTELIKKVGSKLDDKLKSGEIKESEMLQEATELMNKMKNIPGVGNIQSMLSKMGIGLDGLGGGGKVNTAAMEAKLNQRMKLATTKERIRAKAEANAKAKAAAALNESATEITTTPMNNHILTDEEINKIFGSGEKKIEKTPRGANKQENNGNKKKRDKK